MSLINYLTKIQFEAGAIQELAAELRLLQVSRPLIVTDKGIVAAGLIERVCREGRLSEDTPVFDATPENPTENSAISAAQLYKGAGCNGIVAIGGGSPLDLAKAASLLVSHPGPLEQYAFILGGVERIRQDKPPVVAVPTTAGTGSEVGRAALVTLEDGRKLGFISPFMIPQVAICDPTLTVGLPAGLTAATGMDAITHCIETYLSPRYNPVADSIALDGLSRGYAALPGAVAHGSDIAARTEMMMAALQGGLTFQKGLGAVHSLSHALGAIKALRLHHGTLNAVLLPAVLRFNRIGNERKYHALAAAMNLGPERDIADEIERYVLTLGLPTRLSQMKVPLEILDTIVEPARLDHSTATNARPVADDDLRSILMEAW